MKIKLSCKVLLIFLIALGMSACDDQSQSYPSEYPKSKPIQKEDVLFPAFPQTQTLSDGQVATIDYSHINQGYVGAKKLKADGPKVNIQVMKDGEKVDDFGIDTMTYMSIPIQKGDGHYKFKIMENVEGNTYAILASVDVEVQLENELLPYLHPNQVVDYHPDSQVVDLSFSLTKHDEDNLSRVHTLYTYVVDHLDYDNSKAKNVTGKYVLPVLDEAINEGKGICFDYASLLAALCRIQNIPAKVITGNTSIEYHAWVEIYLEGKGWINPKYEFEKEEWTLVDPTFDASGSDYEGSYEAIRNY